MGRFYCDYCHCYLTYDPLFLDFRVVLTCRHDSASVRKAHNLGRNHLQQVREYYQKLGFEKTQSVIDSLTQDYQSQVLQATTPNPFAAGLAGGSSPSLSPPVLIIPSFPYPYAPIIIEQVLTYIQVAQVSLQWEECHSPVQQDSLSPPYLVCRCRRRQGCPCPEARLRRCQAD